MANVKRHRLVAFLESLATGKKVCVPGCSSSLDAVDDVILFAESLCSYWEELDKTFELHWRGCGGVDYIRYLLLSTTRCLVSP
jgi:hypothetical protein